MNKELIQKYNIAGPRYTSYPTVPYWNKKGIELSDWVETFQRAFSESNEKEGLSIYIHLPFCEHLCTFCACHKQITQRHDEVEVPYITSLLKEWQLYVELFPGRPSIREIHLGGGTPTFFSPDNLKRLIEGLFEKADRHDRYEFSFEGHPNNTSKQHLQTLYDLGFTRASFGVQDYNLQVQKAINRIQPFENVKRVTDQAREIGYYSVSHDLVFGLPFQNINNIIDTIEKTKELKPDRLAFYSYAHVPWIKGVGQRGFSESDLPETSEKRLLYETGKERFDELGYIEIGMDHFSLPTDTLFKALEKKSLHRNFMGYTANNTQLMIGLGMSAISDSWYSFAQNVKTVKEYQSLVEKNMLPIFRGHLLSPKDLIIRRHILNIMCHFETSWQEDELKFEALQDCLERLEEMEKDGLVTISSNGLKVPVHARPFVRNICMAFDLRLIENQPATRLFSMTI